MRYTDDDDTTEVTRKDYHSEAWFDDLNLKEEKEEDSVADFEELQEAAKKDGTSMTEIWARAAREGKSEEELSKEAAAKQFEKRARKTGKDVYNDLATELREEIDAPEGSEATELEDPEPTEETEELNSPEELEKELTEMERVASEQFEKRGGPWVEVAQDIRDNPSGKSEELQEEIPEKDPSPEWKLVEWEELSEGDEERNYVPEERTEYVQTVDSQLSVNHLLNVDALIKIHHHSGSQIAFSRKKYSE